MDRTINVPSGGVERTIAMLELLALAEEPLKLASPALAATVLPSTSLMDFTPESARNVIA